MNWLDVARDSRKAANVLTTGEYFRSAVSRAYYAAYSKVSQELVDLGVSMPERWEGPKHGKLRPTVEANLTTLAQDKRVALSRILGRLYALRLYADYFPSTRVEVKEAREAITLMKKVFESF